MLYLILLLLGILAISGEMMFIFFWISAKQISKKEKISFYAPKTCVIVPCKGVTKDFKNNIKAICNQNYKDYTIIFVTDSSTDPAYKKLKQFVNKNPKVSIEIVDSYDNKCSGKIAALLKGIQIAGEVDVYVFADSDIRPHKEWLRNLVYSLNTEKIGATTGFRWYFPHGFKSSLLSTWNLASISLLFNPILNYAWGGSTGIRRQLFRELDIETKWRYGFSDDLILTTTVKNAGYKIKFVPKCIVESFDDSDINTFIKWGNIQYTWVKWYYPSIWISSFIGLVGVKFLTLLGIILIITGFILPGLLMLSTILFEMIFGLLGFVICKKIMHYPAKRFGYAIKYALIMPIAFFFISYNFLASLFKNSIVWKRKTYRKSDLI